MTTTASRPTHFKKRTSSTGLVRAEKNISAVVKTDVLQQLVDGWLLDAEYRRLSPRTLGNRRGIMTRLQWFVQTYKIKQLDTDAIRQFLAYVGSANGVRWGNATPGKVREVAEKPISASTVETYYVYLQAFMNWCVSEGLVAVSPLTRVAKPDMRSRRGIVPFSTKQLCALLDAAATSQFPERETALIMFLVDTGVRASECVSILIRDVDKTGKSVIVTGKGNKQRTVRFGRETSMAIWRYLRSREDGGDGEAPLFVSHAGNTSGSKLCRDALGDIIQRMGKAAGIIGVRCSPHTLRHTFAIQFLRNGGNSFALQGLLGHTDMKQTAGYVRIANLNLAEQHVLASPMDNLRRK